MCYGKVKSRPPGSAAIATPRPPDLHARMTQISPNHDNQLIRRVHQELIDDYDEELEMEQEDWEVDETGHRA
ncbi:MAG: hypothetical protein QG602_1368, partial [Verrucomicrobiota bacterium]|nr:hypothetical protein [Verrucomicrobiota bacterium]